MIGSKFDERVLAKAVQALNKHLPVKRKTLLTLLSEDKPAVQGRDNSVLRIKKEELHKIANLIPQEDYGKLRLPIYIELTSDYGRGIARVHGKSECEIVRKLLGKESEESKEVDEIFMHRGDMRKLRRELQTATQYAFFYKLS
ncbi:MAG: DUF61 family protein [Methanophagales archaeon]|nr:DUF61 family protein [Methanophagales archaeon]MCW3141686.1 DUF61 family protein [Methanophagales archaeon]